MTAGGFSREGNATELGNMTDVNFAGRDYAVTADGFSREDNTTDLEGDPGPRWIVFFLEPVSFGKARSTDPRTSG